MSTESSNVWGFLDGLTNAAATVISSKNQAETAAKTQNDQTAVKPVATAQVSLSGSANWMWIGIGAAVLIGGIWLLRRR